MKLDKDEIINKALLEKDHPIEKTATEILQKVILPLLLSSIGGLIGFNIGFFLLSRVFPKNSKLTLLSIKIGSGTFTALITASIARFLGKKAENKIKNKIKQKKARTITAAKTT